MPVRSYSGAAKATSLTGAVTAATTIINVADATGWPTGASGPFVVTIDAGVTTEEKVLVSGRTGNSLTVSARGFDDTTASDHGNAASVQHTISAADIREANAHVNDTSGDPHPQYLTAAEGAALYPTLTHTHNYADPAHSHTYDSITLKPSLIPASVVDAAGDLIVGSGADAVTRLAKGADGSILSVVAGALAWSTPGSGGAAQIASGAYTGDGTTNRTVTVGFTPKIVFLASTSLVAVSNLDAGSTGVRLMASYVSTETTNANRPALTTNGFIVSGSAANTTNTTSVAFNYVAIG